MTTYSVFNLIGQKKGVSVVTCVCVGWLPCPAQVQPTDNGTFDTDLGMASPDTIHWTTDPEGEIHIKVW